MNELGSGQLLKVALADPGEESHPTQIRRAAPARATLRRFTSKVAQGARVGALAVVALAVASCSKPDHDLVQGYIEGEFVYVSSPLAGTLRELQVQRGAQVKEGEALFALDSRVGCPCRCCRSGGRRRLSIDRR